MKSILNTLDIFLGHLAAGIMRTSLYLLLFIVALFTLLSIPVVYLEETLGLSELDAIEIGVSVILGLVIWRFFKRGRQLCLSWWQLTRRFVFVLAITGLITILIEYLVLIFELTDKGTLGMEFINRHSDLNDFIATVFVVLAIYAGAPLPTLWNKKASEVSEKPEAKTSPEKSGQPIDQAQSSSENHDSSASSFHDDDYNRNNDLPKGVL
uniref:hypothetical protein n=1 Tax=Rheinheimera sp. TaxID=1869214 RepID=UPI00404741C6